MPHLAVVANGASGPAGGDEGRAKAIRDAFREWGADPTLALVRGDGLAQACRRALEQGADVLVAAGGDGTVSACAGVAAAHGVPLAVLPLGTLNHFAKDAGLPLGLEEAARVAVQGRATPVDVAEVNGRVFVNNASLGLYPAAVRERERRVAAGGTKAVAMVQAAGTVLQDLPLHHLRIAVDGEATLRATSCLVVGNNVYTTQGTGVGTRERLDGGRLGVYTVRRPGRRAVLGLAARALAGRLDGSDDLDAREAREVIVDSRRPRLRLGVDGEVVAFAPPLRFRTRPGGLLLVRDAADGDARRRPSRTRRGGATASEGKREAA